MCVLSVNVANQKIFVLVWVWLALMAGVTCLGLLLRAVSLASARERRRQLERLTWRLPLAVGSALVQK